MARRRTPFVLLVLLLLLAGTAAHLGLGGVLDRTPSHETDLLSAEPRAADADRDVARGPGLTSHGQDASRNPGGAGGTGSQATGLRITGRCVDAAGKGIANARVISIPDTAGASYRLTALSSDGFPGFVTQADGDGRFAVPVSKDAPFHVVLADAPGLSFAGRGAVPIGADITLRLEPAEVLEGRVLDPEGKPIAGARVRALLLIDCLEHVIETTSQADGRYRLAGLPAEQKADQAHSGYFIERIVEASADGYALLRVDFLSHPPREPGPFDLKLARGFHVKGRVDDFETGAPIPGAALAAYVTHGSRAYTRGLGVSGVSSPYVPFLVGRATSAADGTWTLGPLASDGRVAMVGGISAHADGYATEAIQLEPANEGAAIERTFRLRRTTQIVGRVLEPSGQPAAGVMVRAMPEGVQSVPYVPSIAEAPAAGGATDAEGRFRIPAAPAGSTQPLRVVIRVHDFNRRDMQGQARQAAVTFEARVGVELDVGDIVLTEAAPEHEKSTVVIVDARGNPIYGAMVGQQMWASSMRTDAEGRVRVAWPHAREGQERRPMHLLAIAPGHAPATLTLSPPPQHTTEVRVVLGPASRLAGRVLRPDGTTAVGVRVAVGNGALDPRLVFTDTSRGVRHHEAHPPMDGTLPPLYRSLQSLADGRFEFADLPPGPYHVRAYGTRRVAPPPGTPDLAVTVSGVAADTLDLIVRLPEDDSPAVGGLLVRVIDAVSGSPVRDAMLFARVDGRVVGTSGSRGVAGGQPPAPPRLPGGPAPPEVSGPGAEPGTYRVMNLPAGRVTLEVLSDGRRPGRLDAVEVVADRTTPTPDVRLVRGACAFGRIAPPSGESLAQRSVQLLQMGAPHDAPPLRGQLAADGAFEICGLEPGTYLVSCLEQSFDAAARVWIPAHSTLVVGEATDRVEVEGPWSVAGVISLQPDDPRLPPPPWDEKGATLERTRFGAGTRVTLTDARGNELVSVQPVARRWLGPAGHANLMPGRYTARIAFPDGEVREETVELQAGQKVSVYFRKKP